MASASQPGGVRSVNRVQVYNGAFAPLESDRNEANEGEPRQRLMTLGSELWLELKQKIVEYNLNLEADCKQCYICLDNFNLRRKDENIPGDSVVQLSCNPQHIFHASCLKEWVILQFTCPICREILIADKSDT